MRIIVTLVALTLMALPLRAAEFSFDSIDGGTLSLTDYAGRPVLVANTASLCGFTDQYADLQAVYDRYRDKGLVVLAVPSDDFRQELGSAAEVKDFCELNYGLDLPMTDITHVRGRNAHPFYAWLRTDHGIAPRWNFYKVLLGPDGLPVESWGSATKPTAPEVTRRIEALLAE
ncbi:glutathione peroxidase [Rhodovulum sp. YNF3179]|uniref:glutathione peroxidase n=1 Tax=Rhodovulum sp. YNF3179 TaxID=3425127 RepID=UPI003D33FFA5